jgi:hypothetical protein
MAKTLQFRRGTTAAIAGVTGAEGELFVDLDKNAVVVMDGSTQGGHTVQSELVSGTNIKTVNGNTLLGSGDVDLSTSFVDVSGDTMTGFLTLSADPSVNLHAATKRYVDEVAQGLQARTAADVLAEDNLVAVYDNGTAGVGAFLEPETNGAFPEIDGVTLTTVGSRILVTGQTNKAHNGLYVLDVVGDGSTPWKLRRCIECDEPEEIVGSFVFIRLGTQYANTGWVAIVDDPENFVVGTGNITWIQFSGAGTFTAGTGLSLDGNEFSVNSSLTHVTELGTISTGVWNASTIDVDKGGTGQTSYTNGQLLIGNTTGNTLAKATLTAGNNISIANGAGSITITGADTNISITGGTSAGPVINSSTGTGATIPSASGTASGVITTGSQTFAGIKTFSDTIGGSVDGNAATATTLETTRQINGTNFNGSADITTATWGTSRTLTIGSAGKAVNGSENVTWTLSEIGVNNSTLTLATSGIASGSQTWTSNQGTNATFTVDVPGTNIAEGTRTTTAVPITSSTGTGATLSAATTSLAGVMSSADKTKLDGIAAGAQVNTVTSVASKTGDVTLNNSDVGLGNVTNHAQVRKLASSTNGNVPIWNGTTGDQLSNGYGVETTLTGSSSNLARADAIKSYVDGLLAANDAMIFKGTLGTGGTFTALPTTHNVGWTIKVITAGTYAGKVAEVGDMYVSLISRSGSGNLNTDWAVIQANIDGAVTGPTSSTDNHVALFDGATGKTIKSAGVVLGNGTLTLATSGIASGSQTFGANQSTNATFTVNVPGTNIAQGTRTTTTVPITSSTGNNATLGAATTSLAGVMTSADKTKLDGIATGAQPGTVTSIATNNGVTGGTITTTGTIGLTGQALALHNLSTSGMIARTGTGTVAARTITAGTGISVTNGNGVSGNPTVALNAATTSVRGGVLLGSDTQQTIAANAVTATATRTYAIQVNASGQLLVNVPWVDTNTVVTITNDAITNATYYPTFATATSGTMTGIRTSSTKLTFNPSTGDFSATNFNSLSDERKKKDIETIINAVELLMQLRGVTFKWKENNISSLGLIAQEVEEVLPEVVVTIENGDKTVSYGNIVGLLIEGFKDHEQRISALENLLK